MDIVKQARQLVKQILQEAPMMAGPQDFGLDQKKTNQKTLAELKSITDCHQIVVYNGLPVYQANRYIFVEHNGRLIYLVNWDIEKHSAITKKTVEQVKVWRDFGSASAVPKIASHIFFNHLLPITGLILSDSAQSMHGQTFWMDRIADAINLGLNVFCVDLNQRIYAEIKSSFDYYEARDFAYGDDLKHANRRFLITDKTDVLLGRKVEANSMA